MTVRKPLKLSLLLVSLGLLIMAFRPASELVSLSVRLSDWGESEISDSELREMFTLTSVKPDQNIIQMDDRVLIQHSRSLLYDILINQSGEIFQYYPPKSNLRIAWYERIVNQVPDFADNKYRYAYQTGTQREQYFAYLATHLNRDSDNLSQLWNSYGQNIMNLMPGYIYQQSGMKGYTEALLAVYRHFENQPSGFNSQMLSFDAAEKRIDPDSWDSNISEGLYNIFKGSFEPNVAREWRRDQAYLDYDDYNEVVWFHSFWLRRWREGNATTVKQILEDIEENYADQVGDLIVLSPTLGDAPDFSNEAKMIFEESQKIYQQVENGLRIYEDLPESKQRLYDEFEERFYMADNPSFYGLDPFYVGGCASPPNSIYASTSLASQGSSSYKVENLTDLDLGTAWVEGVEGNGIGQSLVFEYDLAAGEQSELQSLAIHNGYIKSQKAWNDNGRVKEMTLFVNGHPFATLKLEDVRNVQYFDLSHLSSTLPDDPVFRFEIREVYPGARYKDVAISELNFGYRACQCFTAGAQVTMADGSLKAIEEIRIGDEVLAYRPATGLEGVAKVEATVAPYHDQMWEISLSDGEYLTLSSDHPIWTYEGWKAVRAELAEHYQNVPQATALTVGDLLSDGRTVEAITSIRKRQQTFTITRLSGGFTAFMVNGLWVGVEVEATEQTDFQAE